MQSCNPTTVSINCPFGFANAFNSVRGCRTATMKDILKQIVTPEPTDLPVSTAAVDENRIFGAAKTLFWVAVSMGIGTALAVLCN